MALGGTMRTARVVGLVTGPLSFLLAFASAFLSAAPFTPAVFVVVVTVPLAAIAIFAGSKRTGWLAIYWSGCAVLAFYTLQSSGQMGDWALLLAYVCGLGLSALQLVRYVIQKSHGVGSGHKNSDPA
jgi:hypothetical protein